MAIGAFLGVVYRNDRKASNLETATYSLVEHTETTIVDNELLTVFRSLSTNVTSLTREQRSQVNAIIGVYSHLELLNKEVLSIGGQIAWALIIGVLAALSVPFAAFMYETSNALYSIPIIAAILLTLGYIIYGIYPARRIRNIELGKSKIIAGKHNN